MAKKLPIIFLLVSALVFGAIPAKSATSDYEIQEGGGLSGLTVAVDNVAKELKRASSVGADGIREMQDAAEERGEIRRFGEETRERLVKAEESIISQGTLIVKLSTVLDEVVKSGDESKTWVQGTFFVVLAGILTCVGTGLSVLIAWILKNISKGRPKES